MALSETHYITFFRFTLCVFVVLCHSEMVDMFVEATSADDSPGTDVKSPAETIFTAADAKGKQLLADFDAAAVYPSPGREWTIAKISEFAKQFGVTETTFEGRKDRKAPWIAAITNSDRIRLETLKAWGAQIDATPDDTRAKANWATVIVEKF